LAVFASRGGMTLNFEGGKQCAIHGHLTASSV
jgi:hypothetical protein